MESSAVGASYGQLLEKTRLPAPSFQRLAVTTLFRKLRSPSPPLGLDSAPAARDALATCLASPAAPVADQAVRELCLLVKDGLLTASQGLIELHAALEGCPPVFVPLFVKGIGFLVRFASSSDLSWGRRFDPVELHPFVKVLLCRVEVHQELINQVLLYIVQSKSLGMATVVVFLRPFLLFSILHTSSTASSFTRDLISSIVSILCSFPSESIAILKLLVGCLKYFPHTNDEESKCLLVSAEYLVDALVVIMRQMSCSMINSDATICCNNLLENLLSLCILPGKPWGGTETILELSKRLLAAQRELGLPFLSEHAMVTVFVSIVLSKVEFEHEHLSALKLLTYLYNWKNESENNNKRTFCYYGEELLYIFPLINLLSSPSRSVKTLASQLLSRATRIVLDLAVDLGSVQIPPAQTSMGLGSVLLRLWHHLWFQEQFCSPCSFLIGDGGNFHSGHKLNCREKMYWTFQLKEYLSTVANQNFGSIPQLPESFFRGSTSLLSSMASILLFHPRFRVSAVDSLAAISSLDHKLGIPFLLTVLFHSNMICRNDCNSPELFIRLLEMLPSLATHSTMVPLILQTLLPMLHAHSKPVLYGTGVRLLCKMWVVNDLAFGTMQGLLEPKAFSHFTSQREICISLAASVRDVCSHNPDRGVDLILSISSLIENPDSVVHALGLESLAYLCDADVIDFYTAWDVVSDQLLDYSRSPIVAHSLCILLRWGAMDAEVYSKASKSIINILWEIGTSRRENYESPWVKAQEAAFESLSHYEVRNVQEAIPEFKRKNLELLVSENNVKLLNAMEKLEVKILEFEHINRRRALKQKRVAVHKVEKLLDVFPQAIFLQGKLEAAELPGAALSTLVFTPKELNSQATTKDLRKVHVAYERALVEIAESLHVSRNIFIALLALQSWKPFMHNWLEAMVTLHDAKSSSPFYNSSKIANDILKTLCKVGAEGIPRISSNIAFAIAALCMVLHSSAHMVVSSASEFLLRWLFEYEHEQRQWSAAISLGLIFTRFDATDRKQRFEVANGLLKVLCNSKSYLVKGACGLGLGFACQNLLNRNTIEDNADLNSETQPSGYTEASLAQSVFSTLSLRISELCPSAMDSLKNLNGNLHHLMSSNSLPGAYCNIEEDAWSIVGLVLGLGYSVVALYHFGLCDAVLNIKDLLFSWISYDFSGHSLSVSDESDIPLCMGSCIALPFVAAFCQRHELAKIDFDLLYGRYCLLISQLLNLKKSGAVYQNFLMASCIGAGSFLSCILDIGVHTVKIDDVKHLMEILRSTYNLSYPPACFGGMLGVVNALGAGAGDVLHMYPLATISQLNYDQESMFVSGPVLSSPACEILATSMVQEIFLIAKDSRDLQIKKYAAWALSLLRCRLRSSELPNLSCSQNISTSSNSQTFEEESLVWRLCMWLRDINKIKEEGEVVDANTIASVLRCLCKAPRLPALDWGVFIRRCMQYDLNMTSEMQMPHAIQCLRIECLNLSLAHASHVSPFLHLVDELSDSSRFGRLELNLQTFLLEHVSNICKIFSSQRLEKLFSDLAEYFSSSSSSYLTCKPEEKKLLRVSFWKGLHQCLVEAPKEFIIQANAEKCMVCLFHLLPTLIYDGLSKEYTESKEEWSVATSCFSEAPKEWLVDMLQVPVLHQLHGEHNSFIAKIISTKAKLIGRCFPVSELSELKFQILNGKTEGAWWNMLVEVAKALSVAEGRVKRQWLLDAFEICCVSEYPSTALRFVGLISSICCTYMPLLIIDPTAVLSDLPVTLPSLLSDSSWSSITAPVADKLWISTERICVWAEHIGDSGGVLAQKNHIDASEINSSVLLSRIMFETCLALKEFLPFEKQLKLVNLEVVELQDGDHQCK
ncbi:protein RST1-like [Zingiber officinale]|uniref:protein RST1-like n=1 Tax=Zingiber officinale TaxID=94328 RepID=UPI001C4B9F17|nr:protein RST1-like [Zingiber officinale]